ncbi:hypothetical protein H2203_003854 [Taxawa tesnikishii (nom. ined.)]|nr:hypothetical protein H2203_003854 [Dothideales sp. JES 119]
MPLPATLRQKIAERLAASFSTNVRIQNLEARVRELEARNIDGITPPSLTPQQDARLLHMVGERPWDEIANHLRLPVWVLKARYNEITPFKTAANNRNSVPKHPAVGFSAEEVAQIMQMRQRGDSWSEVGEAIGKVVNRVGEKYELLVRRSTLSDTMPVAKTSAKVATVVGTGIRKQVRKKSRGVLSQYAARTLSGPSFDRACSTRNDVDRKHRNEEDSSYLGFTMSDDFNILRLHLKARSWEQIAEVLGRSVSEIKTRFDELVSHTVEEMEGNDTVIINTDKDALPENDSYEDVVTFIQDSELAARYTNKAKGKAPQDAVTRKLSATNQSDTALDSEVPVRAPTPARIRTCSAEMFAEDFKASRSSLIRRMRTKTPSIVSAKTLRGFFSSKSKKSL